MFGKDTYNKPVKEVEVFLCFLVRFYRISTLKRMYFPITGFMEFVTL